MKEFYFKSKKGWQCKKVSLEIGDYKKDGDKVYYIKAINGKVASCQVVVYGPLGDNQVSYEDCIIETASNFEEEWVDSRGVLHSVLVIKEFLKTE